MRNEESRHWAECLWPKVAVVVGDRLTVVGHREPVHHAES